MVTIIKRQLAVKLKYIYGELPGRDISDSLIEPEPCATYMY